MFIANYSSTAKKFLKKLDKFLTKRLLSKVEELREDPFPKQVERVISKKEKVFRVRVGDYRILYEVDYKSNIVGIIQIDKRRRAYK